MGKHAYAIIAHDDLYCLNALLECIDDKRNDIFLLIDRKSKNLPFNIEDYKISKSNLSIISKKDSIDIRWGHISLMEAELKLLKKIIESNQHYDYIHLISGVDLPIKNQNQIHTFFNNVPKGSNFVGFANDSKNLEICRKRTDYYHFFLKWQKTNSKIINVLVYRFNEMVSIIQDSLNLKRKWKNMSPKKGTNWVTITPDFTSYLIKKEKQLKKIYKHIPCVDEIFIQTEIFNSKFKDTIYDINKNSACGTRKIDWERGGPYTWTSQEYDELIASDAIFARKFSATKDKLIIDKIKQYLLSNESY